MTLTPEQQSQLDFSIEMENRRHAQTTEMALRNQKQEVLRMAKDILMENMRNAPVGERAITADDVITMATQLEVYLNA